MGATPSVSRHAALVDTDPARRRVLRPWIERTGLSVIELSGGGELLARQPLPHLICLDLGIRDMRALEVLALVIARDPQVPVVVMADEAGATAGPAMRAGAYDFVPKPVNPEQLARAVGRALERRELTDRVRSLESRLQLQTPAPRPPLDVSWPLLPLRELEQRAIRRALDESGGNVSGAARLLGIGRATIYRRMAQMQDLRAE